MVDSSLDSCSRLLFSIEGFSSEVLVELVPEAFSDEAELLLDSAELFSLLEAELCSLELLDSPLSSEFWESEFPLPESPFWEFSELLLLASELFDD